MAFIEEKKRTRGDRKDAVRVKDATGLNVIMNYLLKGRVDNEVYIHNEIDITELLKYIEKKNQENPERKLTMFHCFVTMAARLCNERPKLNRFIRRSKLYERDQISISFVAKRKFTDHAEEALVVYKAKAKDTVEEVSRFVIGDVKKMRSSDSAQGLDDTINKVGSMPWPIVKLITSAERFLDFMGIAPDFFTEGDPNYSTVLMSNLGSVKCPAVYHHLNNYGSCSILFTIGVMHKGVAILEDNSFAVHDFVDIGVTLDERIADGFYFSKSLKLFQYICNHPEILDMPLEEDSNYDYK